MFFLSILLTTQNIQGISNNLRETDCSGSSSWLLFSTFHHKCSKKLRVFNFTNKIDKNDLKTQVKLKYSTPMNTLINNFHQQGKLWNHLCNSMDRNHPILFCYAVLDEMIYI